MYKFKNQILEFVLLFIYFYDLVVLYVPVCMYVVFLFCTTLRTCK